MSPSEDRPPETDLKRKIRLALDKHPPKAGVNTMMLAGHEVKHKHRGILRQYKAVAAEVGCSIGAVQAVEEVDRALRIGEQRNPSKLLPVLHEGGQQWGGTEMEIVRGFRGWNDAFFRLKIVIDTYRYVAKSRGDVYAESFLMCMRELCEKGEFRASKEPIR